VRSSGRKAQGKELVSQGELADEITGSEPAGIKAQNKASTLKPTL